MTDSDVVARCIFRCLKRLPFRLRKIMLMIKNPQIEIPFRSSRELLQYFTLADHFDDRLVDRIVPIDHRFLVRYIALQVKAHDVSAPEAAGCLGGCIPENAPSRPG